jgi:hypothetical protein
MEIEQKREDSILILIFKNAWSKHGNMAPVIGSAVIVMGSAVWIPSELQT